MGRVLKIAITGGIASGKTTVCQFLKELGATVVFADSIVHELLHTDLKEKIIEEFGSGIVKQGQIDRKVLADLVFQNPAKLQKLEALIHPAVLHKIEEEYKKARGQCFVAEIPLLYEIGAEDTYDFVIAVIADDEVAKKRFKQGETEYLLRMKRQLSAREKSARADYVITNNGTVEELKNKVVSLFSRLTTSL